MEKAPVQRTRAFSIGVKMPRDILAQTEFLPFLPPVQRTVKIIPSEEIHVQTLFVEEWAARTINQTLFTPKGNRVLDIRLVQPEGRIRPA